MTLKILGREEKNRKCEKIWHLLNLPGQRTGNKIVFKGGPNQYLTGPMLFGGISCHKATLK